MNREEWNKLVADNGSEFLQSWEWGEFQRYYGRKVERIADDAFCAQVIFEPLPLGRNRAYIPRGPVVFEDVVSQDIFWQHLHSIADRNTIFIEADPAVSVSFLSRNTQKVRQPLQTSVLDLTQEKKDIYEKFHKDLRYSIRKAEEKNVRVQKGDDINILYNLLAKTAQRHSFRIWPRDYYQALWQTLAPAGMAEMWTARLRAQAGANDTLLSAALFVLFGKRATYLYGASDHRYHAYMGSHMLHWQVLQTFKERGLTEYDFWGVDKKEMPGVTRFKLRFGGDSIVYPGVHRSILNPGWYWVYRMAQKFRS